ncbi:MAG: hypothetical protein J1E39_02110 [Eubacterium sp.]|nr:hypothetical protein [Eubacterium sp.]
MIKCNNCGHILHSWDEAIRDTEVLAWIDNSPYPQEALYCPECGIDDIYEDEEEEYA